MCFELGKIMIQLFFRYALSPFQLFDPSPDFGINPVPVLQQPAILLLLGIKQVNKRSFGIIGSQSLHLLLQTSFERDIMDLNSHG